MSEYEKLFQQIKSCTQCVLSKGRIQAVPGEGSPTADIMFIGEGPGSNEDRDGKPFIGRAGSVLTGLLEGIGLSREDVYITNMVKCRPPDNRDPMADELSACSGFMDAQIALIKPKVIVTLGRFSFGKFFPGESITNARGKPRRWKDLTVYPMYHPAASLYNPKLRPVLEHDFGQLTELIGQVVQPDVVSAGSASAVEPTKSEQVTMF
ncbi:MAG: uracil-DNA glycosylase [SAR202 cluster bacterium Casp-Chloro-G4]|nr:uracil-DNA glycosylase [Chloroflexota bacterium]MDA1226844.1 uracil-DNA glycosylase [Chloroflexota bacterium]PKB60887.1 MAG: uracil-DNA glycosylase [SAR202 cluster bacterium Casp-Chloro-G4]